MNLSFLLPSPVLTWALALSLEIWEVDVNPHRLRKTDSMDLGFFGHPICEHDFVKSRQVITAILLHLPNRSKTKRAMNDLSRSLELLFACMFGG